MNYPHSDSSGTDDDIPPSHQNRYANVGRASANGRSAIGGVASLGTAPFPPIHSDMEAQIHQIEQEAYSSVLRAFKAQSDAITWEKESLITELRKELRVSDEEHRELLSRVNADDIIWRIREWRASGLQTSMRSSGSGRDPLPSPTVSASRKKQKASHPVAPLSMGAPSPALHPMQPSSSAIRRGPVPGVRGKKPKSYSTTSFNGRGHVHVSGQGSAFGAIETAEVGNSDPLVGKKVWTRWPEDNSFYEAVITHYDHIEGRHALVYDINTADETWEWVNLKEMSPEDLRWEGEDPGISHRGGRSGPGRGFKNSISRGGAFAGGRGRGIVRNQTKRSFPPSQNGINKKILGDIEILDTDTLVKEVEKVFGASHLDSMEIEKAKNVLKEHEQALIDAIARLEDASDGESDRREPRFSNDQEKGMAETTL
ncbi:protein EMSY-LIKE 3 [Apium graveolens]|uniref:protein EMSY-LIKE 3 n=1 Tax=Apium graveolens TaxID=4045 RepID=UPI003D78BE0C